MLTRHSSREISLQSLFNLDSRYNLQEVSLEIQEEVYQNIIDSFHKDTEEDQFSKNIIIGVVKNLKEIDDIIIKTTPDWGIEKTAIIDRNILRLAIYELFFSDAEVPSRVVINEAIEIAKTFGNKKSFKFISGVLGSIYEKTDLKEKDIKESDKDKKIIVEKKVGAMPYYFKDGEVMFLLVHNVFNRWTLPKGTAEGNNKNEEISLENVLKEKLNIEGQVGEKIGENEYRSGSTKTEVNKKFISYYVFEVTNPNEIKVNENNKGLNNAKWFNLENFNQVEKYDDMKEIINKGVSVVTSL